MCKDQYTVYMALKNGIPDGKISKKIGCKSGKRNEAFTTEMSPARHMNSSQGNVPPFLQLSSGITSTKRLKTSRNKTQIFDHSDRIALL